VNADLVVIDDKYRWKKLNSSEYTIHYVGQDIAVPILKMLVREGDLNDLNKVGSILAANHGFFAAIIETNTSVLAIVDHVRSYPLFYFQKQLELCISNSPRRIMNTLSLTKHNQQAVNEFVLAGYTNGRNTLLNNVFQLQAGEFLVFDKEKKTSNVQRYFQYFPFIPEKEQDADDLGISLNKIIDKIFIKIINRADGAPIWVPLSGGLDSRLIVCKLKEHGYENVHTFSYGPIRNYEAKKAKLIAEKLGYSWRYISSKSKEMRRIFNSTECRNYWSFADGLSSVPVMNDFYSIKYLKEKQIISDEAIIINGQTGDFISGGHIPKVFMDNPETSNSLENEIIKKHYSVWSGTKYDQQFKFLIDQINQEFTSNQRNVSRQSMAAIYESLEWQERQAKLVVNGQRVYDYFNLKWELPLWDRSFVNYWEGIPTALRFEQSLFKKYLRNYNYHGLFNDTSSESRRWIGLAKYIVTASIIVKKITGISNGRLKKYLSFWGHYHDQYSYFGIQYFWKHIKNANVPPQGRGVIALSIIKMLEENNIPFPKWVK
jgi:asparagine synthase (glutamine-hydrolysing)